jgi:hypothetical protein
MPLTANYEHMVKLILEWDDSLGPLMFFDPLVAVRLLMCTWTGTLLALKPSQIDLPRDVWEERMDCIQGIARLYLASWAMEKLQDENP